MPTARRWAIRRLATIALLLLVVATLLSGCAVITRRLAKPQVSTPRQVLLDATFDDGKLDRAMRYPGGVCGSGTPCLND
jgi:hypothetical protein